jgi:hypothetical protein
MAAQGRLPGAAKIGCRWTFDERALRAYVKDEETAAWKKGLANRQKREAKRTSTSEVRSGGVEYGLPAAKSDGAYEQAIRLLQAAGSMKGAGRSSPRQRPQGRTA